MMGILTGCVLAAGVAASIWYLPREWFDLFLLFVIAFGLLEYARLFLSDRKERIATVVAGMIGSAVLLWHKESDIALGLLLVAFFVLALFFMWRNREMMGVGSRFATAAFGIVYIGVTLVFFGWLRELRMGREWILLALIPMWLSDTGAMFIGERWGKRPFAPVVSPKKTWEGFAGALLGSGLGAFIMWRVFFRDELDVAVIAGFALLIGIVSPLGDLVESMLKRSIGVKDSGLLIPHHGGLLDRLDAIVFTIPMVYVCARMLGY